MLLARFVQYSIISFLSRRRALMLGIKRSFSSTILHVLCLPHRFCNNQLKHALNINQAAGSEYRGQCYSERALKKVENCFYRQFLNCTALLFFHLCLMVHNFNALTEIQKDFLVFAAYFNLI